MILFVSDKDESKDEDEDAEKELIEGSAFDIDTNSELI